MTAALRVDGLVKRYGHLTAVDRVSLAVEEGEIFGIIGPNGSGKTTTVECAQGLRRPDAGTVQVFGLDPQRDRAEVRRIVGSQLQESALPDRIRVWEALRLFGCTGPSADGGEALMAQWGLAAKRDASFAGLSGGQQQRLFIALALVHDPRVVFLDEMTTGLDPAARRVAVFDQGRVLATGPPHRLVRELGGRTTVRFGWIDGLPALDRVPGVVLVERDGPTVTVIGDDGMLWHLGHALVAAGVELKLFWREPVSVVFTLTLPLLILVVLGGVFGDTPDPEFYRGVGPMTFYAPAYVGLVLGSIAVVVLAWLGYGADLAVSWGGVAVAFVAGALCLAAVGVLLGTVFRTARAALGAGVLLWFVTLFLAGGGPPPEALGRGLRLVGESTPAHYVIRARPCGGRRGHGGVLGVGPAPAAA